MVYPKVKATERSAGSRETSMLQCRTVATVVFGVGYLGSRLVQELLYQGREVIALENFFASDRRAIDGFCRARGFRLVEGSIVDPDAVARALGLSDVVDAIYLLAAQASAHPDAASPEYSEEVNLRGPRLILDAVTRRGLDAPVVFASSTRVYGSPLPALVDESTPYGVFTDLAHLSKCYVEKLLEMYAALHGLRCRVVRLGLVYGVAPVMKTDPRFMTAPNLFCYQAARGLPLEVRQDAPLAVIHVEDAMRALIWTSDEVASTGFAVFNGPSAISSIPRIAAEVQKIGEKRGVTIAIRDLVRSTSSGLPEPSLQSSLVRGGFSPRRQLGEGLSETFDYFRVHAQ